MTSSSKDSEDIAAKIATLLADSKSAPDPEWDALWDKFCQSCKESEDNE